MRYLKLFENFSPEDSLEDLEKKMDEILKDKVKNKGKKENAKLAALVVKKCREKYPSPHYITTGGRPDPKDTTNKWDDSKVSKDPIYRKAQEIFSLSRPKRNSTNLEEWIDEIRDKSQKEEIEKFAEMVKNGRMSEEEFELEVSRFF